MSQIQIKHQSPLNCVVLTVAVVLIISCFKTTVFGEQKTGTITGYVRVEMIPDTVMLEVMTDQEVCGKEIQDFTTLVDPIYGVANAVISVRGLVWNEDPPEAVINNKGCHFVPRVQVAKPRSQVEVQSDDQILHSTHAYDDRQRTLFNIAIPFPGLTVKRLLRRPGVVRVECDSHSWMRGWIYVTNDISTVSGSDGRFELSGILPGTYELSIWHEQYLGMPAKVTVPTGGVTEVIFTLQ